MTEWLPVATHADFSAQNAILVWLEDDWQVAIFALNDEFYAVDARCTHQDEWLHVGTVDVYTCEVTCPLHDARFNLKTGAATQGPAAASLIVYPLRIDENGMLWLQKVTPWWR
jgi:3-phenylpropionate/trans-cinnamate dioxygenase ferredoxin subunit